MKVVIIDAFTDQPFKGNPAGVCLLENDLSVETMQNIARELNLSETAFIKKSETSETDYSIRYFTPTVEIDFCGHATLASSKLLLDSLKIPLVNFTTFKNLKISAVSEAESIKMIFPIYTSVKHIPNSELLNAFDIENALDTRFSIDLNMIIIEVVNNDILKNLMPNFVKAIQSVHNLNCVVVTAKSTDNEFDFYSRCFCPWIGINEDAVTGSSHSVLAKYWAKKLDKTEMIAYQSSKRGGFMSLKIINDNELEVTSKAVIVFEGIINL